MAKMYKTEKKQQKPTNSSTSYKQNLKSQAFYSKKKHQNASCNQFKHENPDEVKLVGFVTSFSHPQNKPINNAEKLECIAESLNLKDANIAFYFDEVKKDDLQIVYAVLNSVRL